MHEAERAENSSNSAHKSSSNYYNTEPANDSAPSALLSGGVNSLDFPKLAIHSPQTNLPLDRNYYPLAAAQTPPALKKFCFDNNGTPTYYKELDQQIQIPNNTTKSNVRKRSLNTLELITHTDSEAPEEPNDDGDVGNTVLPSPTASPTLANPAIGHNIVESSLFSMRNSVSSELSYREALQPRPEELEMLSQMDAKALPDIINTFDNLPQHSKSYLLLQLLRRCPLPTLQFISCLILPTLRRDFLGLLPVELSTSILQYLDLRSLGRCMQVSKGWKSVVESPAAEVAVWKHRLSLEGWLKQSEIDAETERYNKVLSQRRSITMVSEHEDMDSDEELSMSHKQRVRKEIFDGSTPPLQPPNLYKTLYRKHHKIRLNWFLGRYKNISFPGHAFNVVTCLQFDADKIVSGSDDHTIHIYETATGTLRKKLEGHEGGVWALQYWNNVLVSGSTDRTVRVWDMETGKCTQKFDGHTSTVRCLMIVTPTLNEETGVMEPAEPLIVTGSRDSTLRVWRLPNPKTDSNFNTDAHSPVPDDDVHNPFFMHVLNGHTSSVRAIAGQGNVLVSGSYDHTVRVWDLSRGTNKFIFEGHTEKVYSVGYSHELQRAASGSMDATVRVWCTKTGNPLFTLKEGHSSLVGLLEFSSAYLVSAAADATLRVWSPTTGKCLATLTGHSAAITCFHHDPKLNKIVSGSDGGVKVWELSSTGYGSHVHPPETSGGPGFSFTQGPNGPEPVHGRFIADVVRGVQGVWRTRMDESRLVCAVQKEGGRTWFEVLDFTPDENVAE